MLENRFKTKLIEELEERFNGCMILHTNPTEIQGIPDLIVLYNDRWAALEGKKNKNAAIQPNQEYYIDRMHDMSFAMFIYPENKEAVLDAMERAFTD